MQKDGGKETGTCLYILFSLSTCNQKEDSKGGGRFEVADDKKGREVNIYAKEVCLIPAVQCSDEVKGSIWMDMDVICWGAPFLLVNRSVSG